MLYNLISKILNILHYACTDGKKLSFTSQQIVFPTHYVSTTYTRYTYIYINRPCITLVLIAVLFTWSSKIITFDDIICIHNTTTFQYVELPNR